MNKYLASGWTKFFQLFVFWPNLDFLYLFLSLQSVLSRNLEISVIISRANEIKINILLKDLKVEVHFRTLPFSHFYKLSYESL